MSTRRVAASFSAVVATACGWTCACAAPTPSAPANAASPASVETVNVPPAPTTSAAPVEPAPSAPALPDRLASESPPDRSRFDVDAGAFRPPSGAFVLLHDEYGDTESHALSKSISDCMRERGRAYVRLAVEAPAAKPPGMRVVDRDGPSAATDCLLDRARKQPPWRAGAEPRVVEIVVLVR